MYGRIFRVTNFVNAARNVATLVTRSPSQFCFEADGQGVESYQRNVVTSPSARQFPATVKRS